MDINFSLILEFVQFCVELFLWLLAVEFVFAFIRGISGKKEADKELEETKEKLIKMIHFVKQEKHGDVMYWFDNDDDAFLAQGSCKDEIIAHLKSRFPTHIFITDNGTKALRGPTWQIMPIEELTQTTSQQN